MKPPKELQEQFPGAEIWHRDDLIRHPSNPRMGSLSAIAQSIQHNGWFGVLVVQKSTRYILVGNHRFEAGRRGGKSLGVLTKEDQPPYEPMEWFPVQVVDVDDARALRILLADNRSSDDAEYDKQELMDLLSELHADDNLLGSLFPERQISKLLEQHERDDDGKWVRFKANPKTTTEVDADGYITCPECNERFEPVIQSDAD